MSRLLNIAKWGATLGSEPQNFLGARWIRTVLARTSAKKKRIWALRMLSLSPHYFLDPDSPKYAGMSNDEYLEAVFASYVESRKEIYRCILKDRLTSEDVVIDYGCGPGFLSKIISDDVRQAYGCDISEGVLACAEILNSAPNLTFVRADENGLNVIPDESVDAVFSYALVQHLSEEIYELVLENCRKKLRPGGRLIFHIQLIDTIWKTEDQWKADYSLQGRIKFKYGLHCFGRTSGTHIRLVEKHGFTNARLMDLAELLTGDPDEISTQSILTATRA